MEAVFSADQQKGERRNNHMRGLLLTFHHCRADVVQISNILLWRNALDIVVVFVVVVVYVFG